MLAWMLFSVTLIALIAMIIFKPLWLVPSLVVAIALEISSTWYPGVGLLSQIMGTISLSKLVSLAIIPAAFGRLLLSGSGRKKLGELLKDPLTILLGLYLVLGGISTLYSADPGKTLAETIRLLILFAVFLSVALLMGRDRDQALLPFRAVHIVALLLAPLSFYEVYSGDLLWQAEHLMKESTFRVNATFVDPNIFARFLVLGIASNFVLQIFSRDKYRTNPFYLVSLAILLAQLFLTNSRGGLITLAIVLLAALILLPNKKSMLWLLGIGLISAAIIFFIRPDLLERLLSLTHNLETTNPQRYYLWKVAIAIFGDHWLTGTGLGSFQTVFLTDYAGYRTVSDGATLSHTSILTIAAELGIIGLFLVALIAIVLVVKLLKYYTNTTNFISIFHDTNEKYYFVAGYFLWALAIFVSSQGEGRFFEDPALWLSLAMLTNLTLHRHYHLFDEFYDI